MKFGSVCSGIEAASVAWHPLGWRAAWFSEIEPFACDTLEQHYPAVPNHGDMTALPVRIMRGEVDAPDVLVGGTPCQAFSVAGNRESLDDARGNLTLKYVEILNAIDFIRRRDRKPAAVAVWENVPGVLTTRDNAFGCFLGALAGSGCALQPPRSGEGWWKSGCVYGPERTVAWRILDAQYFGVAQRRERVFVIASARQDIDPSKILLEWEGMRRDSPPRRDAGEEVASTIAAGSFTSGAGSRPEGAAAGNYPVMRNGRTVTNFTESSFAQYRPAIVAGPLRAKGGANGQGSETLTLDVVAISGNIIGRDPKHGGNWFGCNMNVSPTLTGADRHAVAFQSQAGASVSMPICHEFTPTLTTNCKNMTLFYQYEVRRLMPIECERLQGFPDGYTMVQYRGALAKDTPRYTALGNSMAVPVMAWLGKRINNILN